METRFSYGLSMHFLYLFVHKIAQWVSHKISNNRFLDSFTLTRHQACIVCFFDYCTRYLVCSTSLICRWDVEDGCARRPLLCTSARRGVSLSAHDSETVYYRRPVCPITQNISRDTKNTFISTVIPIHCSVATSP